VRYLVTICLLVVLLAGCEGMKPYEGKGRFQTAPSGVGVVYDSHGSLAVRGSREFKSKVAQALDLEISKYPTLTNFIRCYGVVAQASYIYPTRHDSSLGVVMDNSSPGYSLFLENEIIISPAIVEGKEGVVVYSIDGAKTYQLPSKAEVVGDHSRYDFKLRVGGKVFPISVGVPRVVEFRIELGPDEDYQTAVSKLMGAMNSQRFAYHIYLRTSEVSKGFPTLDGEDVLEEKSVSMIRKEIVQRLEDILANSLDIGMDFRGELARETGDLMADSELRMRDVHRLPLIEGAVKACRAIKDSELQQAVDKLANGLGYSG